MYICMYIYINLKITTVKTCIHSHICRIKYLFSNKSLETMLLLPWSTCLFTDSFYGVYLCKQPRAGAEIASPIHPLFLFSLLAVS